MIAILYPVGCTKARGLVVHRCCMRMEALYIPSASFFLAQYTHLQTPIQPVHFALQLSRPLTFLTHHFYTPSYHSIDSTMVLLRTVATVVALTAVATAHPTYEYDSIYARNAEPGDINPRICKLVEIQRILML